MAPSSLRSVLLFRFYFRVSLLMIRRLSPFLRSSTVYCSREAHTQPLSSLFPFFKLYKFPFSSSSASSSSPSEMAATNNAAIHRSRSSNKMKKLVVIMGPTGSGKSKLSIDMATRFFPNSEIINSDKIQVYRGLDITTNKISMQERRGVPHHFLGEFDPETEFTRSNFRSLAQKTIAQIISRRNLPLLVGGSNSFIHALLARRFNLTAGDVFDEWSAVNPLSSELRYNCCFIWVDVNQPVLNRYLDKRVDDMLDSGMFEELSEYFAAEGFAGSDQEVRVGLRKAIGVPEFARYFRRTEEEEERVWYEGAVKAVKDNTCKLAKRQLWKIKRLREAGWDLHKVDATEAFRAAMMASDPGNRASEIWEKMVVEPTVKIMNRFLKE